MPVTLWILPRPPRRELNSGDCCGCDAEERTSDLSRQPSALVHQLSDIRIHPLDLILQGRGPNAEVRGLHFQSSRRYELPTCCCTAADLAWWLEIWETFSFASRGAFILLAGFDFRARLSVRIRAV